MAYFTTRKICDGVYSIFEKMCVGETVIVGAERALLIDTSYGFLDIRPTVRRITKKPLLVMNSHVHPDHSGGNTQFSEVYVGGGDLPYANEEWLKRQNDRLLGGIGQLEPRVRWLLFYFRLHRFRKYQTVYHPLPERFDLGGRVLRVLDFPGHTPGSALVADPASRTLFVGDALNPSMWMFTNPAQKLGEYARRLKELQSLPDCDWIWASHEQKRIPLKFAGFYADFLTRVDFKRSEPVQSSVLDEPVYRYAETGTPYGDVSVLYCAGNL